MSPTLRTLAHTARSLPTPLNMRTFSLSTRVRAGGDTGSPRSGGSAQGDAFTKREQASEDYYVRQQEKEKLHALKAKIAESEKQLEKDRKDHEELAKKQGGT